MIWNDKRSGCFTLKPIQLVPIKMGKSKQLRNFSFWGRIINFDATNITVL